MNPLQCWLNFLLETELILLTVVLSGNMASVQQGCHKTTKEKQGLWLSCTRISNDTSFLPAFRISKNLKHDSSGGSEALLRANILKQKSTRIKSIVLLFSLLQALGRQRSCTMRYQLTPLRTPIIKKKKSTNKQ